MVLVAIIQKRGRQGTGADKGHTGRNTLDTTTTRQTTDSGLGDTLNVVAKDLAVTLGAAFAETFTTFAACELCQ